ncbi:MAG: ParB/RepB/Spo0J family partition protein [Gemmatimonadetes bacterium]|nr:ParB/RepB/Spo0J family partition protein [Gemmatimonadota bacterium]
MTETEQPPPFATPLDQDAYEIALDHIEPDPDQPRKTFDDQELADLAASIRENGLLQPILVHKTDDPAGFRIIAGERRYRAAKLAGLRTVPCLEMPRDFDPDLIDQLQLVENIQRADLRPLEAAEAIESYIERHGLSQRDAARRLGKPTAFVAELLAIRRIRAELLVRAGAEKLSKQTLVEIGRAPDGQQEELFGHALSGSSLDQIRERRANREAGTRVVYFNERFLLERFPAIEIRWRRHPDEVTDEDLVRALEAVARQIATRHGH